MKEYWVSKGAEIFARKNEILRKVKVGKKRHTCKAMTDCRKAQILANAFTQTGPLTLLSKYADVEFPYAQYPTKVTAYIGKTPAVN